MGLNCVHVTLHVKCKMQAQKLLNSWRNAVPCCIYIGLLHKLDVRTSASGKVLKEPY